MTYYIETTNGIYFTNIKFFCNSKKITIYDNTLNSLINLQKLSQYM